MREKKRWESRERDKQMDRHTKGILFGVTTRLAGQTKGILFGVTTRLAGQSFKYGSFLISAQNRQS